MQRNLRAAATAAGLALCACAQAQSASNVTLYGIIDQSIRYTNHVDDGGGSKLQTQLGLTGDVHALHRFVEHQQLRLAQQGAGQQHALHFAPGHALHRAVDDLFCAHFFQGFERLSSVNPRYQAQKTQH